MRKINLLVVCLLSCVAVWAQSLEIKKEFTKEPYSSVLVKFTNEFREHEMPDMAPGERFPYAAICVNLEGDGGEVAAAKRTLSVEMGMAKVQERVTDKDNMLLFLVSSSAARVSLTCGDGCSKVRILDLPCLESNAVYSGSVHFVPYREERTEEKVDREQLKQELLAELAGMLKEQSNVGGNQLVTSKETAVSTQSVVSESTPAPSQSVVASSQPMMHNGHEYVDLGLSVKWATCNVGATRPEDAGDYFAWGETQPKSKYDLSTYKWCRGSEESQTKYCTSSSYGTVDNKTVLEAADDAARANWGGSWRMPTDLEQDELREKCTWTWTTQNGVNGYKVTSKSNGKSIFLPAASCRDDSSLDDAGSGGGFYWSSSLFMDIPSCACNLFFTSNGVIGFIFNRYSGFCVRPVCQ